MHTEPPDEESPVDEEQLEVDEWEDLYPEEFA